MYLVMKLETKQTEVRLIAESDVDRYYLDNFFGEAIPLWVTKRYDSMMESEVCQIMLSPIKESHNEPY